MKNAYSLLYAVVSPWLLILFFAANVSAQEDPKNILHFMIMDDGNRHSVCGNALDARTDLEITLNAANLLAGDEAGIFRLPTICEDIRIRVREMETGTIIGVSDPISEFGDNCDNRLCGLGRTDEENYNPCSRIFCTTVSIQLDMGYLCGGKGKNECHPVIVQYELIKAYTFDWSGNGTYELYGVDASDCTTEIFPEECFCHAEEEIGLQPMPGFFRYNCRYDGEYEADLSMLSAGRETNPAQAMDFGNERLIRAGVRLDDGMSVRYYPNPVQEDFLLEYPAEASGTLQVEILGTNGHRQSIEWRNVYSGKNNLRVPMGAFPAGVYFCRIWDGRQSFVFKVVKSGY